MLVMMSLYLLYNVFINVTLIEILTIKIFIDRYKVLTINRVINR